MRSSCLLFIRDPEAEREPGTWGEWYSSLPSRPPIGGRVAGSLRENDFIHSHDMMPRQMFYDEQKINRCVACKLSILLDRALIEHRTHNCKKRRTKRLKETTFNVWASQRFRFTPKSRTYLLCTNFRANYISKCFGLIYIII